MEAVRVPAIAVLTPVRGPVLETVPLHAILPATRPVREPVSQSPAVPPV